MTRKTLAAVENYGSRIKGVSKNLVAEVIGQYFHKDSSTSTISGGNITVSVYPGVAHVRFGA